MSMMVMVVTVLSISLYLLMLSLIMEYMMSISEDMDRIRNSTSSMM